MAVQKRIKSFSPYKYNVQYAKPGQGLNQKANYIKSSPVNIEEYVVSKKDSNFFTYLTNVFSYAVSDECESSFLKCVSTFRIVDDKKMVNMYNIEEIGGKLYVKDFEIRNKNSINTTIIDDKTIRIFHNFNSTIDAIVLLDDEKYLNFKIKKKSENECLMIFDNPIFTNSKSFLHILIYPLNKTFQINENIITYTKYKNKDIIFDEIKDIIAIDNKDGSANLIPIIYDFQGETYNLNCYDLNPSHVSFEKRLFYTLDGYELNIKSIIKEIDEIKLENPNIKEEILNDINEKYRNLKNSLEWYQNRLNKIKEKGCYFDISEIILYKLNTNMFSKILTYGINDSSVEWFIDNGNYCAIVKHNLKSIVKIILDSENIFNYNAFKIDENTIKINFGNKMPKTYTLNIYKVI